MMTSSNGNIFCVTERTNYTLDTLSTEYTQQAFKHASGIFHRMCQMQVSKSA